MTLRIRLIMTAGLMLVIFFIAQPLLAADRAIIENGQVKPQALLQAGGVIGYVIIALSVAMVALVLEHLLSIRKGSLMPRSLAEQLHQMIGAGQFQQADQLCKQRPTFLSYVVMSGLQEANFGYNAVEKAMEDASIEQAARLSRKIEYLSMIVSLAPMLGLMGTVWGMIQAFAEFTEKANPMPADFAPAISEALVTTLFGLCVAVPALAAYFWFRNRIDEYVAETTLMAEHVISPLRRTLIEKRKATKPTTGQTR